MNSPSDICSLYWGNHTKNLKSAFDIFRCDNELVDVTLSCEGRKLKAHKIVLSACSVYFLDLFRDNPCQHPIIILRDVKYQVMADILNFMYQGEVSISIEHLDTLLKTAEMLQVKGLIDESNKSYAPEEEHQNKRVKQISTIKKLINNQVARSTSDTITDEEQDDLMQETMDLDLKTESESEDHLEHHSSDYLDLTILPNTSHDYSISPQETRSDSLQRSMSMANSMMNKDSFPCRFCDKVFSHPNSLKLHLPSHSGSTSCALCQAVLSRKYELKVHMRKKHNIELN